MKTETLSYLKKNAATLELNEPMCITQNGVPTYVIESYASRKRRDEAVAMLKLLSFSVDDEKSGRVISNQSLKNKLAQRKQKVAERSRED
ncbi:type II toxin-antitoxin system Phd/YefM family antitoxin [Vibrio litoralis]|uniref:type II toxin-antitoxin system Phd/YefM family antitoxin n=1 Tax=Vibrio litoralis TaxID=335972 RepID=UPI001868EF87|nr:type II toxin-antitoxin system Phd/YefM family antitoxin [Vibrio litoralis]